MKKLVFLAIIALAVSCKGPGSGPLARNDSSTGNSMTGMEGHGTMNNKNVGMKVKPEKITVSIEPCKDCIKISDLFANSKTYEGRTIRVKGQVTRYNAGIMGKNWIHIQDGSDFEGNFDLTLTTDQEVEVGATATFEGKISLDKDFGYGYTYKVLMEDSKTVL